MKHGGTVPKGTLSLWYLVHNLDERLSYRSDFSLHESLSRKALLRSTSGSMILRQGTDLRCYFLLLFYHSVTRHYKCHTHLPGSRERWGPREMLVTTSYTTKIAAYKAGSYRLKPVVHAIINDAMTFHSTPEEVSHVGIIRSFVESEATHIRHIPIHTGKALTHFPQRHGFLHLHNGTMLSIKVLNAQPLPRQGPIEQLQQRVAQRLQIIATGCIGHLMGPDGRESGGAYESRAIASWDMLIRPGVEIAFRSAEVDDVDGAEVLPGMARENIGRLDIPVNEAMVVDMLKPADSLDSDNEAGLQREAAVALADPGLQGGAQAVEDHDGLAALPAVVVHARDAGRNTAAVVGGGQQLVHVALDAQEVVRGVPELDLDGVLLALVVRGGEDLAEAALPEELAELPGVRYSLAWAHGFRAGGARAVPCSCVWRCVGVGVGVCAGVSMHGSRTRGR